MVEMVGSEEEEKEEKEKDRQDAPHRMPPSITPQLVHYNNFEI